MCVCMNLHEDQSVFSKSCFILNSVQSSRTIPRMPSLILGTYPLFFFSSKVYRKSTLKNKIKPTSTRIQRMCHGDVSEFTFRYKVSANMIAVDRVDVSHTRHIPLLHRSSASSLLSDAVRTPPPHPTSPPTLSPDTTSSHSSTPPSP